MKILSPRPVGVRRGWKRSEPDMATLGDLLRRNCSLVSPDWGDPIEGQGFRERKGMLRRVDAAWTNGRIVSISYTRKGTVIRFLHRSASDA